MASTPAIVPNKNMALPLMHIITGDYDQFEDAYQLGRGYRQPLMSMTDKDDFAQGIEIFFDNSNADVKKVYSMFQANVIWRNNKLILSPEPETFASLKSARTVEGMVGRIIYENLDPASVAEAMRLIIKNAYEATNKNHPVLKLNLRDSTSTTILQKLNSATPPEREGMYASIGDAFITSEQSKLIVMPGDYLGFAAAFQAADWLPPLAARKPWFKTIADADRARKLTITMKDVGRHIINPFYYLHKYAAKQTVITINKEDHPLLQGADPLYGRDEINGTYLFPMGWLNEFHKFPATDPDSLSTVAPISLQEWKYDDTGKFVPKDPLPINTGPYAQNKFKRLKQMHFSYLDDFCRKTQLPLEVIFGLLGAETDGTIGAIDARAEPLKNSHILQINNSALELKYQKFLGIHVEAMSVTKSGNDFRFKLRHIDGTPALVPDTSMNVQVPQRLYYAKNKYFLILKEKAPVAYETIKFDWDKAVGAMQNSQGPGKELFYSYNSTGPGAATAAAVEKEITEECFIHFDRNNKKVLNTKPTIDGDITVTLVVNGVAIPSMSYTLGKGQQILEETDLFRKCRLMPGNKICVSVKTDLGNGTGNVQNLGLYFLLNKRYEVLIQAAENNQNNFFNDIIKTVGGMQVGDAVNGGQTRYYPVSTTAAGKEKIAEVVSYKIPSNGFILLHDIKRTSNNLTNNVKVSVLRKKTGETEFKPTAITVDLKDNIPSVPLSVPVLKDDEVILEVTAPAEPSTTPPLDIKKIDGLNVQFNFIPFDGTEAFFTSRHAYEFDLAKKDRSDPNKPISTENGRSLTWQNLYDITDKTKGDRLSVGPNQFLILSAMGTVNNGKHFLDEMELDPFPATPHEYIDTLCSARVSMALGATDARLEYNYDPERKTFETRSTCFDAPLVGAVHNSYRVKDTLCIIHKTPNPTTNPWGMAFARPNEYISNSASMINQAQDNYNDTDFKPSVRFKK